jgi:hypothetical protein
MLIYFDGKKDRRPAQLFIFIHWRYLLFVDSVGRPDLREEAKKYASLLYPNVSSKK